MNTKAHRGRYQPKNPEKYRGDASQIVYRSSWELRVMRYFDLHPDILEWNSEGLVVPYLSPIDNRIHRYFVDFWIKKRDINGKVTCAAIEVKPYKETRPPERKTKVTRRFLQEAQTFAINTAKWSAAEEFCKDRGWSFIIMTEKEIYGQKGN
jgi:hypothetical protein